MRKLQFDLSFCVGRPAARSIVWRVFATSRHEDVYVSTPDSASSFKFSLHESGKCHAAFGSAAEHDDASATWSGNIALQSLPPHLATGRRELGGRFHRAWSLVEASPGLYAPIQVAVPADSLTKMSTARIRVSDVLWIDPGPIGSMVVVSVVLTSTPLPTAEWPGKDAPGTTSLGMHSFPSGKTLWILGSIRKLSESDSVFLRKHAELPVDSERKRQANELRMDIPRMILPCLDTARGTLGLWDVNQDR